MQLVWTLAGIVAYGGVLTWVAVRARTVRRFADFSVAGRSLPLALTFGSLAATYVGPAFSIGFVGRGFSSGYLFLGLGLAVAVQNALTGLFVAPRLRATPDCHTLGDVIGRNYSRGCQVLAGLISVGLCVGFSGVMLQAGGRVTAEVLGLPLWASVFLIAALTCLYTVSGGLRASVLTDALQFVCFVIFMGGLLLTILASHRADPGTLARYAHEATVSGGHDMSWRSTLGWITAFLLGETLIPPYANRALASRSTRISRNAFLMAAGFSVLWFAVMTTLGVVAGTVPEVASRIQALPAAAREDAVLTSLIEALFAPPWRVALLVVILSVVMSSLDSLLNAGAVSFTRDIARTVGGLSDDRSLCVGRRATAVIALGAAVGALYVPSILTGLKVCYSIWAPAILPALLLGLWLRRPPVAAGLLSMLVGTLAALVFEFLVPVDSTPVPGIVAALVASLGAYGLGMFVTGRHGSPRRGAS